MPTLIHHLATVCSSPLAKQAQVVWRNSELTATLTVQEPPVEKKSKKKTDSGPEIVFEVDVPKYEVPPIPPAAEPIAPVETTVKSASL